ncbi:hypothetical protein [Asanoa siamensis]|uniref:PknH-like extracellular domain-containing protein n=1 Tax=Asanoa siamensis TaxID=926357 RepID=A0ABQ4CIG1_9ACTN|nr:hypothetical protein [Asanoa siamensis]GIF71067.1 hypothetical protein Asi02nite_05850 [Asanoa siamensis]
MDEQRLDDVFDRFRGGAPLAVAAGADAAREAFRRRRHTRAVVAGAFAALAVAAPSVAFAAGAFDRTPPPPGVIASDPPARTTEPTQRTTAPPTTPPSTPPRPTEPADVPAAALLRELDVPAGYRYRGDAVDGDWSLAAIAASCDPPRGVEPPGVAQRGAAFRRGPDESLLQVVERMPTSSAARQWLDELPDRLGTDCGRVRFAVVAEDFAGDGSLVVRATADGGEPNLYVFVRQGPLLTQIWQKHQVTVGVAEDLGRAAADRLCQGTAAC